MRPAYLLFKGYLTGPHHNQPGSGSNFLCLHEEPQWASYFDGHQQPTGSVYGVAYGLYDSGVHQNNVFSATNSGGRELPRTMAPCAACYVQRRSTILMIPARTQCPDGWTKEYGGYLASELETGFNRKRSSYICLDEAPEIAATGISTFQGAIHPVEVQCGSLPCEVYRSGRELTCVVCSK